MNSYFVIRLLQPVDIWNDRGLDCDDAQFGVKAPHIARVTRDHRMPRFLCADDNVRIGNVRRSAARKQRADSLSVASIQRYDFGPVTLDQTPETHLPCRIRMTCASAVAGTTIRSPSSRAVATNVRTRRLLRSNAIRPPASKVTPFTRSSAPWTRSFEM